MADKLIMQIVSRATNINFRNGLIQFVLYLFLAN